MEMARGELREETGLDAALVTYVGHLFEACGYSNQGFHIFLATGLRRGNADLEREEQDLVTREFTLSEVERMIRDGGLGVRQDRSLLQATTEARNSRSDSRLETCPF